MKRYALLIAGLLILAICGIAELQRFEPPAEPTCDGKTMEPGDTCDIYVVGGGDFRKDDTRDYYEQQEAQRVLPPLSSLDGVCPAIGLVLVGAGVWVIRRRRSA